MTQKEMILQELQRGETVTIFSAAEMFGVHRLSAVVQRLRHDGHAVVARMMKRGRTRMACYELFRFDDLDMCKIANMLAEKIELRYGREGTYTIEYDEEVEDMYIDIELSVSPSWDRHLRGVCINSWKVRAKYIPTQDTFTDGLGFSEEKLMKYIKLIIDDTERDI